MDQKERRGASDFRFSNIHLFKRTDPVANVSGLVKVPDAAHPFIAPGPTDQRGPCPALNTLTNHGYLPHNGIVNMDQMIEGTAEGFNMGADVATLLATLAIIYD
ncbi:hypothetical protein FRB94_012522 [Tulasnella sp. JGI-2019a]|nr:hypothetical protein FRB94_012522 [Tulasnella sp. JGI-2019a]